MQCAICGEVITKNISKDHVYPRAIWKWQEESLNVEDFSRLKKSIESSSNIVKTHPECNYEKEDTLVEGDKLHLTEKQRLKLDVVRSNVEPFLPGYIKIKAEVTNRQSNRCFLCDRELGKIKVLRRIDKKAPRTQDNGCMLCHECNREVPDVLKAKTQKDYK